MKMKCRLARILAARGGGCAGGAGGAEGAEAREVAAFRRSTLSAYLQGTNDYVLVALIVAHHPYITSYTVNIYKS